DDMKIRAKMETLMAPINRAPDSFESIITYGHPPLKRLGEVANDMMKVQGKFNEQVNILGDAMDKLQNGMNGMNLEQMSKEMKDAIKRGLTTGGKGILGAGKGLKGIAGAIIGKGSKKSEDDQYIEEMQETLPQMLFDMLKLVKNIEEAD